VTGRTGGPAPGSCATVGGSEDGTSPIGDGEPPDRVIQIRTGTADENVRMLTPDDPATADPYDERSQGNDDEYLPVSAVARAFHVSPKTVARWADEGRIPHIVTLGGHRRFPRQAIDHLVEEMRRGR